MHLLSISTRGWLVVGSGVLVACGALGVACSPGPAFTDSGVDSGQDAPDAPTTLDAAVTPDAAAPAPAASAHDAAPAPEAAVAPADHPEQAKNV